MTTTVEIKKHQLQPGDLVRYSSQPDRLFRIHGMHPNGGTITVNRLGENGEPDRQYLPVGLANIQLESDPSAVLLMDDLKAYSEQELAERSASQVLQSIRQELEEQRQGNLLTQARVNRAALNDSEDSVLIKGGSFAIPSESVVVMYGLTGAGKSFLVVDLAASLATGRPWLGMDDIVSPPQRVLFIQLEGAAEQVFNRFQAWCAEHDVPEEEVWENVTHDRPYGFDWSAKEGIEHQIIAEAQDPDVRADVVIIDNLDAGRLTGSNVSDETVGAIFARVLPALTAAGLSVLLVAHPNGRDDSMAGLTRQHNAAEAIMHVKKRAGEVRILKLEKQKDVAGQPEVMFRVEDSSVLSPVGPVGVVRTRPTRSADNAPEAIVEALRTIGGPSSKNAIDSMVRDELEYTVRRARVLACITECAENPDSPVVQIGNLFGLEEWSA